MLQHQLSKTPSRFWALILTAALMLSLFPGFTLEGAADETRYAIHLYFDGSLGNVILATEATEARAAAGKRWNWNTCPRTGILK